MTTFEIITIVLLAAIAVLLAWHCTLTRNNYSLNQTKELKRQQDFKRLVNQLYDIKAEVGQTNGRIDGFIPAFKKLLEHNESIENFWAADSSLVIKLLEEIENDMNEHGIAQAKWFDSMSNKLTTIGNHTNETTNKVAELVDFEKRNEQRNDELFARCEEINKLQLAELKLKTKAHHTDDVKLFPPKDVVGVTATGICQECNGRNVCKYYDVNRNRCFVADRKEG